jgi:polysaccharide deacetylase 2 family uncharacterized protein YibQ
MPAKPAPDYHMEAYTSSHQVPAVGRRGKEVTGPGTVAIIIDDMGASLADAEQLLTIAQPVTFAIIPGLAHSRGVAEAAHAAGREVLLHIPMEPQGYPGRRLEPNGLLVSHDHEELVRRMGRLIRDVPHAIGANNHMGSSFTEHREQMASALGVLKEHGLFFIDSKTTPRSVGTSVAVSLGVGTASRNLFLDNDQRDDAIASQLDAAARLSRKRGTAIAIGHPYPETLRVLKLRLPQLAREGITFVPVSVLVRP